MVVAPKAGEAPVKPIDVWANQTQKRPSLLGLDSPLFGATTIWKEQKLIFHPMHFSAGAVSILAVKFPLMSRAQTT